MLTCSLLPQLEANHSFGEGFALHRCEGYEDEELLSQYGAEGHTGAEIVSVSTRDLMKIFNTWSSMRLELARAHETKAQVLQKYIKKYGLAEDPAKPARPAYPTNLKHGTKNVLPKKAWMHCMFHPDSTFKTFW